MHTRRSFLTGVGAAAASAVTLRAHGRRRLLTTEASSSYPGRRAIGHPPYIDRPGQQHAIHLSRRHCNAVDAGAIYTPLKYTIAPKPDNLRRPGEYLARYIKRQLTGAGRKEIDVFLPTHFHDDHVGAVSSSTPLHASGLFHVTGISDVAGSIPVTRIVDRGFPSYDYPAPVQREDSRNYAAFAKYAAGTGVKVEMFIAGSSTQLCLLRDAQRYPGFKIQNLGVNGKVWTGRDDASAPRFPPVATLEASDYPSENMCSLSFRLDYGGFRYYTGGDLECDTDYGKSPWRDIESAVARAAGPVNVAVANHHGYVNAVGPAFVQQLRPQAFVIMGWDSAHPTIPTLDNMLSKRLYPGNRDVFATALKEENVIATRRLAEVTSGNGHVVVRVDSGGASYRIFVLDNMSESNTVIAEHGPYQSRA